MGVANATIRNSTLGHQGINAIGSGTFTVENSTIYGRNLVNLRPTTAVHGRENSSSEIASSYLQAAERQVSALSADPIPGNMISAIPVICRN